YLNTGLGSVQFANASVSVPESGGTTTLNLTRTGDGQGPVSVVVSVAGGSATAGQDFTFAAPQTVTWADGDSPIKTVTIPITNDQTSEGNETVQLSLTLPTTATWATLGSQPSTTLTIVDDDPVTVNIANASASEGNSGTSIMSFPVTLTGAANAQTIT